MYEIFPVVAGIISMLAVQRWVAVRSRPLELIACSVVFGAVASLINGELFLSWAFLIVDTGLVLLGVSIVLAFRVGWLWRGARVSRRENSL